LPSATLSKLSLTHFDAEGNELATHPIPERTIVLGRRAPDLTLDPGDSTLSRRQLAITGTGGERALVKDLKSVNGTYLRVRSAILIQHGDQFRVGQQLFTFSLDRDAVLDAGHVAPSPKPLTQTSVGTSSRTASAAAPDSSQPSVTFRGLGKTLPVAPGQTLCDVAEAAGLPINAECHSGICGSDPLRILSGHEFLVDAPSAGESETLEDICDLEPGPCRLACMARITGPVEVDIL